jgi:hypothetical protein
MVELASSQLEKQVETIQPFLKVIRILLRNIFIVEKLDLDLSGIGKEHQAPSVQDSHH